MTVPDWMLERLVLKDLSPEETADVMRQLEEEEGGLERLAALEASTEAILELYPPRVVALTIEQELQEPRRRLPWLVAMVPALLAAVVLVFAVNTGPTEEYIGSKGEPRLMITQRVDGGVLPLEPGEEVGEGDVVQLSYAAMGARHGVIVSIDGAGVATLHFPIDGDTALDVDGVTNLSVGYRLDDAPAHERFFLVTSDDPIDVEEVLERARSLARRPDAAEAELNTDLQQTSVLLRKEGR